MSQLFLWSYDASPFTQRVLRMLAFKGLAWNWVETPMLPPKDELVALTGGYRGTPVLQVGADVYVDSQLIARELDARFPAAPLRGADDAGTALMLVRWSDAFFRSGLTIILGLTVDQWPAEFRRDREYLFPDIDFASAAAQGAHARAQYRAHCALIERQLADGRPFLAGERPGLVDSHAWPFLWMARGMLPALVAELTQGFERLVAWEARVAALGEGRRTRVDAAAGFAAARAARSAWRGVVEQHDGLGLAAGEEVTVEPDDTRRGAVRGRLLSADAERIALAHEHPAVGQVTVHFPRLGYRLARA